MLILGFMLQFILDLFKDHRHTLADTTLQYVDFLIFITGLKAVVLTFWKCGLLHGAAERPTYINTIRLHSHFIDGERLQ